MFPQSSFVLRVDLESGCPGSRLGGPRHSLLSLCSHYYIHSPLPLCGVSLSLFSLSLFSFILINTCQKCGTSVTLPLNSGEDEVQGDKGVANSEGGKDLGMNKDLQILEGWHLKGEASPSACAQGADPEPGSEMAGGKVLELWASELRTQGPPVSVGRSWPDSLSELPFPP